LSTESGAFDYRFQEDGEYQIDLSGSVEDIYGNSYSGAGTYKILAGEQLDIKPATLFMTPFQAGDAFNPG